MLKQGSGKYFSLGKLRKECEHEMDVKAEQTPTLGWFLCHNSLLCNAMRETKNRNL